MHLRVGVAPGARREPAPIVTFVPNLECANPTVDPNGPWGARISFRKKRPENGLHLFPSAVLWLPQMLRAAAVTCGPDDAVLISRTVDGVSVRWGAFSPSDAQLIADRLEVIGP